MKKSMIILPLAALLCVGCTTIETKAEETVGSRLQNLIRSYVDDNGQYTKKTTICLNEAAHKEMDKYFHAGQVQAKRTTYYDDKNGQLLMAEPNGTLDPSYGGYRLVKEEGAETGNIYSFHSNETTTLDNMFDGEHITQKTVASYKNKKSLNDAFVSLETFLKEGYYQNIDWGYDEPSGQFYHDLSTEQAGEENNDIYYPDILAFAAPMLKPNYTGSKYFHIQSIGFSERYDTNAVKYLSIKIYVADEDTGKLTGECGSNTLSEARIYKGIRPVGDEDFTGSVFLKVWDKNNQEKASIKLKVNTTNDKELYTQNVAMEMGDHAKFWSTTRQFNITNDFKYEHNLTVGVSKTSTGDYVAENAGTYDFYAKFKASNLTEFDSTWVNYKEVRTIYLENNWYKGQTEYRCYYFGGEGVNAPEWDDAPYMIFDSHTDKDIYRVVIPANTEKVIFRHANWEDATQTEDIELGENNIFYFDKIINGKTTVGSYMK